MSKITRREFIETAGAVAAGMFASEELSKGVEAGDHEKERLPIDTFIELLDAHYNMEIAYPERPEPVTPEAKEVIRMCMEFDRYITDIASKSSAPVSKIARDVSEKRGEIWSKIRSEIQKVNDGSVQVGSPIEIDPSATSYTDFVLRILPRRLAKNRIVAFNLPKIYTDARGSIVSVEAIPVFFDALSVGPYTALQWGETIKTDIISVQPFSLDESADSVSPSIRAHKRDFTGTVAYGNIFLDPERIREQTQKIQDEGWYSKENRPYMFDAFCDEIQAILQQMEAALGDAKEVQEALQGKLKQMVLSLASMLAVFELRQERTPDQIQAVVQKAVIAHEAGHLACQKKPAWRGALYTSKRTTKETDREKDSLSKLMHHETNAILSSARYSEGGMYDLFSLGATDFHEYMHDEAARYLVEKMVEVVESHKEEYLDLKDSEDVTSWIMDQVQIRFSQILAEEDISVLKQLPEQHQLTIALALLPLEKQQHLAAIVMSVHDRDLHKNLLKGKEVEFDFDDWTALVAGGASALILGTLGIKKIIQRRIQRREHERLMQRIEPLVQQAFTLSERPFDAKKIRQLSERLQVQTENSNVDWFRWHTALQEVTGQYVRDREACAPLIDYLEETLQTQDQERFEQIQRIRRKASDDRNDAPSSGL